MVRKIATACVILLAGLGAFSGCTKGSSPVSPRTGNVSLSLPVAAIKAQIKAQNIVSSASATVEVKYNIVPQAGGSAVQGSLNVDLTSNDNPTLSAALPGIGKYLVAVEVFNLAGTSPVNPSVSKVKQIAGTNAAPMNSGNTTGYPVLLGAEMIDVQGTTSATLKLGRLDTSCYNAYVYNFDGYYGYNFDKNTGSIDNTSDIGMDANGNLINQATGGAFITYLGNKDLVEVPQIASDAKFYATSLDAKGGAVSVGDVFGIRVPTKPNALVWLQVTSVPEGTKGYIQFCFRYNDDGYNYYRFDMTSYGQINCNDAVLYGTSDFLERLMTSYGLKGIDVDGSGNLYIADSSASGVSVIDAAGNTTAVGSVTFGFLRDVAIGKGSPTTIYALDSGSYQIKAFGHDGVQYQTINLYNDGAQGIAADQWGFVYVSFQNYTVFNGIVKYDTANGGTPTTVVYNGVPTGAVSDLYSPMGMAVDGSGNLFVADSTYQRVQVYDKTGVFLRQITNLSGPYDVTLDGSGGLWVADYSRILKFNASTGTALSGFSSWTDASGNSMYFNVSPIRGIAYANGKLYVGSSNGENSGAIDVFKQ
jgi:hypothetical protein